MSIHFSPWDIFKAGGKKTKLGIQTNSQLSLIVFFAEIIFDGLRRLANASENPYASQKRWTEGLAASFCSYTMVLSESKLSIRFHDAIYNR